MPNLPDGSRFKPVRLFMALLALILAGGALTGCASLHGSAQVGSDGHAQGAAGVSIPFGK